MRCLRGNCKFIHKKLEKSNFLGSRCRLLYMPVKKLLDGNGCLKARNFANIYSKHACDPSFDAPGCELSNALRIMSIGRIVFPRKNFSEVSSTVNALK